MNLSTAIYIATNAHAGQVDKGGQPYILHPLRVMLRFKDEVRQIVSVLHDVSEDKDKITLKVLKEVFGFSDEVIEALNCLTRRKGENYFDYIERIKTNPISRDVKIEDLRDNMNLDRLSNITDEDMERFKKYCRAVNILLISQMGDT
jgi:(p)ppGpp synthase/HD superfamily hydrolase